MVGVDNISKKYGQTEALRGVSFNVSEGEVFGIIGPDGAGKTTLFRILTTLILADSGFAFVDGMNVEKDFQSIRDRIGYMPGRFSLYQDLTVRENLDFYATVFGTTVEENYDLVKDIYGQIEQFSNRRAGALSGGMKQKLALCCALIHRPRVLMLDEPTTGVDPVSRKEFWGMLSNLKRQGITILVSTPYMDEANLCDRIALIQNGKILDINTPAGIVGTYPDNLYALKSESNYRLLNRIKVRDDVEMCYISGEFVHAIFKTGKAPLLDRVEIRLIKPTVEDCFIRLMR